MSIISDDKILVGFKSLDEDITKEYFYGYCRRAYNIFDNKYQLRWKNGLDFYSLAHEYYIQLLTHNFKPLLDKPKDIKLSTWMVNGFHYVVLDALKAYNKEYEFKTEASSEVVLEYLRSADQEEGMLLEVAEAVASHYHDRVMQEIAHMVLFAGFKQKEVAAQLGVTPAAVNLRYKKMMDEVVTPFVVEHYGKGLYLGRRAECECSILSMAPMGARLDLDNMAIKTKQITMNKRITPAFISTLEPNEIFVFGSNLQGIHAGGAARMARLHFGAEMGKGVGIQGQSYAIPTMQGGAETIQPYVEEFVQYARQHPELHFLVTPIGCGLAGFEPEDIAPLFKEAKDVENVWLPEGFWDCLD